MPHSRHVRRAVHDRSLSARILRRGAMLYAAGADVEADRPAHVRAASSLAWIGSSLAVVQDDVNFLALVDPSAPGRARAIPLPRGADGCRQFDDRRGNKHLKLDLEACFVVAPPQAPEATLVALGSGSTPAREVAAVVRGWDGEPRGDVLRLPSLYRGLRAATDFAGSELNVEGTVLLGDCVRLFGRGNGARGGLLAPLNATCDLAWADLQSHLDSPFGTVEFSARNVVRYELGALAGVPLGFTDAAAWGDSVVFTAAAEDSPDVTRDGPVFGSVVGVIHADGAVRWVPLSDEEGSPVPDKIEGVVAVPGTSNELLVTADADMPEHVSELCLVRLDGPWAG